MALLWTLALAKGATATFEHEPRVCPGDQPTNVSDSIFKERVVVYDEAMGARAVVAGDINKDGRCDLVVASSTDNSIRWFENLGDRQWSRPQKITYDAKGARVVALADIDGDGYLDVVYVSYYDNTLGWFRNVLRTSMEDRRRTTMEDRRRLQFISMREFKSDEPRYISRTVDEGQGVVAADLDGDGDVDIATASSGDSSIAWYENMGGGRFCEIKRVVDDDALGARSVVVPKSSSGLS